MIFWIDEIEFSKRLPPSYEAALDEIQGLLLCVWTYSMKRLYYALMSSPEFVDFLDATPNAEETYTQFTVKESERNRWPPILSLLVDLSDHEKSNKLGALNILDEMEHLMESDTSQRTIVNTAMIGEIARVAALAYMRDAFARHQPRIQQTRHSYHDIVLQYRVRLASMCDLERHMGTITLNPHIKPLSILSYPIGKKRTQQHVEQMRLAEAKLDSFWEQVDKGLKGRIGKTSQQLVGDIITPREIQRTAIWVPNQEQQYKRAKLSIPEPYEFPSITTPVVLEVCDLGGYNVFPA